MGKQSGLMKRLKVRDDVKETSTRETFKQYMTDMFIIALNDPGVMGKGVLGYQRITRVVNAAMKNCDLYITP